MYLIIVLSTMLVLPLISTFANIFLFSASQPLPALLPIWFVFWAFGVRLFLAGLRQIFQPEFTAEHIFDIEDRNSHVVIRELGFANTAMGVLGILSIIHPVWILPASILGFLFYGMAGVNHIFKKRNRTENIAMISDLLAGVAFACVCALYLVARFPIHI